MSAKSLLLSVVVLGSVGSCTTVSDAQPNDLDDVQAFARDCKPWDDWRKPSPVFQVHGNTYYVGSCGITALVVLGSEQAILFDTAEVEFAPTLQSNLARVGVEPRKIGWILGSHEHYDHVGGVAEFQRRSGAEVIIADEAKISFTGQMDPRDPQFGMHDPLEQPDISKTVSDGDVLTLANIDFTVVATPGHTPGALTWQWTSCDGSDCKTIVYADSLSPVSRDDYKFSEHPEYIAEYRAGLERLAKLECDILLTPHPSASFMQQRASTGSLVGGMSCKNYSNRVSQRLDARLKAEANIE